MSRALERLKSAGFDLPPCPPPGGNYAAARRAGSLVFLSGAIGTTFKDAAWSLPHRGAIGGDVSLEQGKTSAQFCVLNHLAALADLLGDLDRVSSVVRLTGYIHAAPSFTKGPLVLDAASDLIVAVFGDDAGRHSRVAVYQHTMSFNAAIETELIVEAN
jgi:enamine deaminase RidA (YjgF/YER057c/UK114 family)